VYPALWVSFCILALAMMLKERKQIQPEWRDYLRFLCVPWKLAIFVPVLIFVTFAGRFTNDETWDMVTGSGMSILTFVTAPWALGLVYQVLKGKRAPQYLVIALALCLFSSSWFYDGYLYLRDGHYTSRWFGNLCLSPIIYLCAGLLWNLEAKGVGIVSLSFLRSDWPKPPLNKSFGAILIVSLPLIFTAAFVLIAFVRWHY